MPSDTDGVGRYETARRFLDSLFGQVEGASAILVWTVKDGANLSHWPESVEAAARLAASADERTNVYVGCGWREKPLGAHARGDRAQIAGIPALWVDLDVAGDGHSAKKYPPSFEDARSLVRALPIPPSIIVNSGGGLHLWWRFREPWAFEDEADRTAAAYLVKQWEATVQQHAAERGWVLDSVHDLSRILRIPGTWRTKQGDPVPRYVDVEADSGTTSLRDDFEPFLVTDIHGGRQTIAPRIEVGSIILGADAQPPADRLSLLLDIEPRFEASWNHRRPDLKDGSESSYDLAVANYAAQAEWTDQEIADLIIARRRKCKADVSKALRPKYITDTITAARVSVEAARIASDAKVRADIKTVEQAQTLTELDATVDRGGGDTEIRAYLSDMFGFRVVEWAQETLHHGYFELRVIIDTKLLVIAIGDVEAVSNQRRFANAVYMYTGIWIGPFSSADWIRIIRALGRIVKVSDVGTSSRTGQMLEWIDTYAPVDRIENLTEYSTEVLMRNQPFRKSAKDKKEAGDGSLYLHAGDFTKWLGYQNIKTSRSEVLATMKILGFEMVRVSARDELGGVVSRCYWALALAALSDARSRRDEGVRVIQMCDDTHT